MTPMIDVVFQLIVFFTATSTIAKTEFDQDVNLPVAETGKEREQSPQMRQMVANVSADGSVAIAGRVVNPEQFGELIAAELDRSTPDRIEVQFRADRHAAYRSVEPLLLVCARAGIWKVGFAVRRDP